MQSAVRWTSELLQMWPVLRSSAARSDPVAARLQPSPAMDCSASHAEFGDNRQYAAASDDYSACPVYCRQAEHDTGTPEEIITHHQVVAPADKIWRSKRVRA